MLERSLLLAVAIADLSIGPRTAAAAPAPPAPAESFGRPARLRFRRKQSSARLDRAQPEDRGRSPGLAGQPGAGNRRLNGNDFRHDLEAITADLNGSYSLGFLSAHPGDGKMHTIRVELKPPGLRADYRRSYRDRSPEERLEGQLEAALIHGYGDNPLAASLTIGTAAPAEHGRVLVPVQLRFPFRKLAFLPGNDGARHGRVTILVGAMDGRGGLSPLRREQLPLRVPEADTQRVLASQLGHDVKLGHGGCSAPPPGGDGPPQSTGDTAHPGATSLVLTAAG